MSEHADSTTADPMGDERLAQIAALSPFPFDHPATQIVVGAFQELLAEVTRLRAVETKLRALVADEHTRLSQEMENEESERHPDDAAVTEVRTWIDGLDDEAPTQFKVRKLRGVLNLLDGWERNARRAADQRNGAYSELDMAKVDMRLLREDVAAATTRAETAERELAEMHATASDLIGENEQLRAELVKTGEELAEMRERIGEATVAWVPGDEYGPFTNTAYTEAAARGQLTTGQKAWWRVVGEWKAADDDR